MNLENGLYTEQTSKPFNYFNLESALSDWTYFRMSLWFIFPGIHGPWPEHMVQRYGRMSHRNGEKARCKGMLQALGAKIARILERMPSGDLF